MTNSNKIENKTEAYVWIFLPKQTEPMVVGRIKKEGEIYYFTYGQSYLENLNSIALSPFELPLKRGNFYPLGIHFIHSCLRDAGPDAWGRRLIDYQYSSLQPNEIDYLLLSGSNRIGALDFQADNKVYLSRETKNVSLEELLKVAELVESEQPIPEELEYALIRGTSVGGARPKAVIQHEGKEYIAKFGLSQDIFNPIKAEYVALQLAKQVGIQVSDSFLHRVLGKDVLIVERFDRDYLSQGKTRKLMLSALSLLNLDEMEARYASYKDLAEIVRQHFDQPRLQLLELYKRLVFNILIGNTDDHARNHSAFWDGHSLKLTPAYDLCPQARIGQEATQAMAIEGAEGNLSKLSNVLSVCEYFQIQKSNAKDIIEKMITDIKEHWEPACKKGELSVRDQEKLWQKSILNPFCFQGWN